jgi:hypothetical protein
VRGGAGVSGVVRAVVVVVVLSRFDVESEPSSDLPHAARPNPSAATATITPTRKRNVTAPVCTLNVSAV